MVITAHQGSLSSQASLSVKIAPGEGGNPN